MSAKQTRKCTSVKRTKFGFVKKKSKKGEFYFFVLYKEGVIMVLGWQSADPETAKGKRQRYKTRR